MSNSIEAVKKAAGLAPSQPKTTRITGSQRRNPTRTPSNFYPGDLAIQIRMLRFFYTYAAASVARRL
jgi:hypothetical protein